MAAVVARGLTVTRGGREVLHGLDFEIAAGEVLGLLGPSGCGKSTLLRSIVGVQAGIRGSLEVLGEPAGAKGLRGRIGYVTQSASVYDDLSVVENLRFFARVLGADRADVDRCLERIDLVAERDQLVRRLSGGQRSRVSLAVALLGRPELLVLDEPTVGLDPVLRRQLWNLFHELATERDIGLIVSSHVMDEARRCDRLLLMRDGRLLADGSPSEITARTGTTDVEDAFLAIVAGKGDAA
jgi:ABC-2 type transport system ATP-binding protein